MLIYIPGSGIYRKSAVSAGDESAEAAFWKVTSGAGLETSCPQAVLLPDGLRRMLWHPLVRMGQNCPSRLQVQGWEISAWHRSVQTRADGSSDSAEQRGRATGHTGCICSLTHLWDCSWRPHGQNCREVGLCIESGTTESKRKSIPIHHPGEGMSSAQYLGVVPALTAGHCQGTRGTGQCCSRGTTSTAAFCWTSFLTSLLLSLKPLSFPMLPV